MFVCKFPVVCCVFLFLLLCFFVDWFFWGRGWVKIIILSGDGWSYCISHTSLRLLASFSANVDILLFSNRQMSLRTLYLVLNTNTKENYLPLSVR